MLEQPLVSIKGLNKCFLRDFKHKLSPVPEFALKSPKDMAFTLVYVTKTLKRIILE